MSDQNNAADQDFLGLASEEPQEPLQEPAAQEEPQGPPTGHPRWNEVYSKMKTAERAAEALTKTNEQLNAELLEMRTELGRHREQTSEIIRDVDSKIEKVKERIAGGYLEGSELAEAITEMTQLQNERTLVAYQQHGQAQAAAQDFQQQRAAWQQRAVDTFGFSPENMQPQLIARAQEYYQSDSALQRVAGGEFYALAAAALEQNQNHKADAEAMKALMKKRDEVESVARQAASAPEGESLKDELVEALRTPPGGREDRTKILGRIFADNELWTKAEK